MEALKMRVLYFAMVLIIMAIAMVPLAAAADPPAPSPTSGAAAFAPAALIASFSALLFGFLFC